VLHFVPGTKELGAPEEFYFVLKLVSSHVLYSSLETKFLLVAIQPQSFAICSCGTLFGRDEKKSAWYIYSALLKRFAGIIQPEGRPPAIIISSRVFIRGESLISRWPLSSPQQRQHQFIVCALLVAIGLVIIIDDSLCRLKVLLANVGSMNRTVKFLNIV